MATVYRARCHVLNRDVAVKVLREEYTTDEEFIKRFNIEAQAVASLTHPNIVSVYDVGHEGNLYYIVMELVKGKTLKEVIVEDGMLGWKWSVKIALQIASALETAHKNNIIHRDIKPHNIIITEDGTAKVTDFGIAKAVSNATITAFGTTIGSVHYFSPEHARGGLTDEKSDLYSLGVVIYEMVTGRVPFDADTPVSVALKHMQEEPIEAKVINPELPDGVNKIIVKAMQKDASKRYRNATEMIKDLNAVLRNPDIASVGTIQNDFATRRIDIDESMKKDVGTSTPENPEDNKKKGVFRKIGDFFGRHKALKIFAIVFACILVFVLSLGITFLILMSGKVKEVQVPDLSNMTMEQAQSKVDSLKLKVEKVDEKYDPTIPEGQIISQDPKYQDNFKIKEGATISVIVSKGQQMTTVPDVLGKAKDEAYKLLQDANLNVVEQDENSDTVQKGYVLKQDTEKDTQVAAGSDVVIHISTGIEQVQVPDLSGKSEADAKAAITSAKLTYKATIVSNDPSKPNGAVVSQDIAPGSTVDKNTAITITVNQFNEVKSANVIVNIKSLTGYVATTEDSGSIEAAPKVTVKVLVDNTAAATGTFSKDSTNAKLSITSNNSVAMITIVIEEDGSEIYRNPAGSKTISGDINIP